MPRFEPLTDASQLPPIGGGVEHATFDLKAKASTKGFHLAKDVAAFANHLGGTLLIGVAETNGVVSALTPLTDADANDAQNAISRAVRDRCSPRPLVDFVRLAVPGGGVLAVNVWPYVGQLVGVAVHCDKAKDDFGDDAYVFPMRVGSDSTYLLPEQLPMFMLPEVRRAVILLQAIPKGALVYARCHLSFQGSFEEGDYTIEKIDEAQNAIHLRGANQTTRSPSYPLDHVRTVFWQADRGVWHVSIRSYQ